MTKQLQANPSTKKISELYTRITGTNRSLILQPTFQRKLVWSSEHKERFIETILKGLPIPELYIAQSGIDIDKIETQEVVVDGQQRLSTIIQYIDEPEDSEEFGNIVPKYKDLEAKDKLDFLNYTFVIRDLGDLAPELIIEIFKRINYTSYGLNQIELHNAIYDGKFITTAKEILERIEDKGLPFLTDSRISRMEDLHFILTILATIEHGGYFSRDSEIEKYIIAYNDSYPNSESIKNRILDIFETIEKMSFPIDSIWNRKSNYFTLFVELHKHKDKITNLTLIREKLDHFEKLIIENKDAGKDTNDFGKYYSYMYTGTTSRAARVVRAELLNKHVMDYFQA